MRRISLSAPLTAFLTLSLTASALAAPGKPDKELIERALVTLERGSKAGDFDVRAMSVEGLAYGPKARTAEKVKDALADPQWNVRSAAIHGLRIMKDKAWDTEVRKATCELTVDPTLGVMPLVAPLGPAKAAELLVKAIESKDCPKPDRYVQALVTAGDDWMLPAVRAGLKSKVQPVREAFEAAVPTLPLPNAISIYAAKDGLAKMNPTIQKAVVARLGTHEGAAVKDLAFLRPLLKGADAELGFQIAALLGRRGDNTGKAILVDALSSADSARRIAALDALAPIADAPIFELMKERIKDRETSYEELVKAYEVYLKSGSTKLVSYLEGELQSTDVPQRAAAVHFIGKVKGRAATADLHPLLNNAPKPIRLAACHALGELAQRESIPVLRDSLARETDKEMKIAMLKALAKMRDVEVIPVARFYIADRDPDVRREAVSAIIAVPDASGAPDLEIASRDLMKDIREMALFALIEQDPENRFLLFEKSLEWMAPEAFTAFVTRHGDKVKRHVAFTLGSPRDDLRSTAWRATRLLSKSAQSEIATAIAAKNERQALRLASIERLVELDGKNAATTLEAFVKDGDEKVRVYAIAQMARVGHKAGVMAVVGDLDDPSERVRVAVAGALLRI